jgi:hypothetical protein
LLKAETICKTISPGNRAAALAVFDNQKAFAEKIQKRFSENEQHSVFLNFFTPHNYLSNLLFRQAVAPQMDIIALASYPQKKYNYADFENSLTNGRIKWMLMKTTSHQKGFFNLRLDKFQLVDTTNGFNLYQFKP